MPHSPLNRRAALGALAVLSAVAACGSSGATAPDGTRRAELLGARVPATVARGAAFDVVGYFGRGACDRTTSEVAKQSATARIGLLLTPIQIPEGGACIAILVRDSVVVTVHAPYTLPYTVRLRRRDGTDSVLVVYADPRVN